MRAKKIIKKKGESLETFNISESSKGMIDKLRSKGASEEEIQEYIEVSKQVEDTINKLPKKKSKKK